MTFAQVVHALPDIPRGASDGSYGTPASTQELAMFFAAWWMGVLILLLIFCGLYWLDIYRERKGP